MASAERRDSDGDALPPPLAHHKHESFMHSSEVNLSNEEAQAFGAVEQFVGLPEGAIKLHVHCADSQIIHVVTKPEETIFTVQLAVQKRTGIAVLSQRFIFNGACLAPDTTVGGAGLVADSICFVLPKTEAFPEKLGPWNMFSTALDKDSFEIPTWDATVGFEGGMFMVTAAAAGQHGVTAVESAANIFPLVGQLSPMHAVTLPEAAMKAIGIPMESKFFVWAYPCNGNEQLQPGEGAAAGAAYGFLAFGGYVYFDAERRIVGTTTIAPDPAGAMHFSKPRRWHKMWTKALKNRFHRITIAPLRETGARWFCWLRPGETLKGADGRRLALQPSCAHGGFAYLFHDDLNDTDNVDLDRYFELTDAANALSSMLQVVGGGADGGLLEGLVARNGDDLCAALNEYYTAHVTPPELGAKDAQAAMVAAAAAAAGDDGAPSAETAKQAGESAEALGAITEESERTAAARVAREEQMNAIAAAVQRRATKIPEHTKHVINELKATEAAYVDDLYGLISLYMQPAQTLGVLTPAEVGVIFGNVERLHTCNTQLAKALCETGEPIALVSRVFLQVGHFFRLYLEYCRGYQNALDVLAARSKQSAPIEKWLQEASKQPGCRGLPLQSFLIKPIQRLLKYPLFFNDLLKDVPQLHPQRDQLEKAAKLITELAASVNAQMTQSSLAFSRVLELLAPHTHLLSLLPAAHRSLLCEFEGTIVDGQGDGASHKKRTVVGFVLTDLFLLCRTHHRSLLHHDPAPPKPILLERVDGVVLKAEGEAGSPKAGVTVEVGATGEVFSCRLVDRAAEEQLLSTVQSAQVKMMKTTGEADAADLTEDGGAEDRAAAAAANDTALSQVVMQLRERRAEKKAHGGLLTRATTFVRSRSGFSDTAHGEAADTTLVETEPGMPAAKASHFVCVEEAEGVFIAYPMATAQPKFMSAWVSYDRLGNEVAHGGIGSSHGVIRGKMQHFLAQQMGLKAHHSSFPRRNSHASPRN